ncbi:helix-turn-helix domain-containing protein [Nostoc sp.]|uniref:helix-turn-helix domain-containing protein n=1 Tax=Nostoc sp. TaxID=1180 RepID=UPI002FF9282C
MTVYDRLKSEEFRLTQEFISQMLGVRHADVSKAPTTLSQAGMITYHRGQINI